MKSISLDFVTDKGEMTEYEYYGYLMMPVDLYKLINKAPGKCQRWGRNRLEAGGKVREGRDKEPESHISRCHSMHFTG